jgi:carbonic anhydrase/acetyltransferase-like protein (isoleucine patch superfamily)
MKMSYVNIGRQCSVGGMSVVLYDSVMEDGSVLQPLSVLMKSETLPAGTVFIGAPAQKL